LKPAVQTDPVDELGFEVVPGSPGVPEQRFVAVGQLLALPLDLTEIALQTPLRRAFHLLGALLDPVARGLSNAEIARQLFISVRTVESHATHIMQKLGTRNRVATVMAALRQGLLGDAQEACFRPL
jgi:hypothetical protein